MDFTTSAKYQNNPILKETFEFAVLTVQYAELLESNRKYAIARQVIRSGTSIGANVKEAQNAESKADETEYWLFLCKLGRLSKS